MQVVLEKRSLNRCLSVIALMDYKKKQYVEILLILESEKIRVQLILCMLMNNAKLHPRFS